MSTSPRARDRHVDGGLRDREALVRERRGGRRERSRASASDEPREPPHRRPSAKLEQRAPAEPERAGDQARGQLLDRGVVGLHRVVVDHARERDAILALARAAPASCANRSEAFSSGLASAMPTTPPMAVPRRCSSPARTLGLGADAPRCARCVAASITERSCAAYAATAALSSGTRSARRRSSASTSPQAALRAVAGARQPVVEQQGEDDDDRHDRYSSPDQHAARLPAQFAWIDARRLPRQRGGVEALDQLGRSAGLGALEQPGAVREPADERARIGAPARAAPRGRRRRGASRAARRRGRAAAGRARSPGTGVQPEQLVEPELTSRRGEQVGAAHDVRDALVPRRRRRPRAGRRRRRRCGAATMSPLVSSSARAARPARSSPNSTLPSMRTRSAGCGRARGAPRARSR